MSFRFYYPCLLLLLLLCIYLHACNSRHLGLLNKEIENEVHLSGKDQETEIPETIVIVLKHRRQSIFEELHPEEIHMAKFGGGKFPKGLDNANPMKRKGINLEKENMNNGIDNKVSSLTQEGLQEKTEIKGWKIQARSTMESKKEDDTKENVKSEEENDIVDDVVVMDYAQPHRKPPIHNLEP